MLSGAPHRPIPRQSLEVTRFIVISGIDGCGKTTLIQELRNRLEREGLATRYEWLRYNHRLVRPVHGLSRLVGLSRRYRTGDQPVWRHEFYRSRLFCSLYILLTWLDVWLGRLMLAARLTSQDVDIVVCDRWIQDILVDLAVDTRRRDLLAGTWHTRFTRILPPGTRQYLIVRNFDSVVCSRPDVMYDLSHSLRRKLYRRLEKSPEVVIVRNDGTVEAAVDTILGDWMSWASRS